MRLLERDDLLARLRRARDAAAAGRGSLVVVAGEAGAGKTSVVAAALADTEARWGWCEPLAVPPPLGPFRDLDPEIADATDRPGAVLTVGERLLTRARRSHTVLVVEDAHWIDDVSADVVRFLGRRIATTCGLLVVTMRDGAGPDHPVRRALGDLPDVERLHVGPLSRQAVADLMAGSDRDPAEAWRVTAGNAFLVAQLLSGPSPGYELRDSVAARLARLTPAARDLVRRLAVVPGPVPRAGLDLTAVAELVRGGLLDLSLSTASFRHELVRQTLVDDLDPEELRRAHAAALAAGEGGDPARLAEHARGAGLLDRARGLELEAARRAARAGAHRQAALHLRRVLAEPAAAPVGARHEYMVEGGTVEAGTVEAGTVTDGGPAQQRVPLLLELAAAERATGEDEAARTAVAEALALTATSTDRRMRGEVLRWWSRVVVDEQSALAAADEAVRVLAPLGTTPELAAAVAQLATLQMVARQLAGAVVTGRRAVALAEAAGAPEALTSALQALGSAATLTGSDPACTLLRRAVSVASAAGLDAEEARARSNMVSAAGEAHRYAVAAAALEESLPFFVDRDLDTWADYARAWQARCLAEQGRWDEATLWVDEVLASTSLATIARITALTTRGRIRARRGDPDVWTPLEEAHRLAAASGSLQRVGPVVAARAEARWLAGEVDDGHDGLRAAYDLALRREMPWLRGELACWLERHGLEHPRAEGLAEPWQRSAEGDQVAAGEAWWALGCPYEAADAWAASEAEDAVLRAHEIARTLGANPLRRRVERRLRALGVRSLPRGPRTAAAGDPDGLTAREQEVRRWVVAGFTDAEIAARLHLSPRTVGHHVSAVLRKTGSTSRRDLGERAAP